MTYTSNFIKQQNPFLYAYNSPERKVNRTLISSSIKKVSKRFNGLNSLIVFEDSDLKEYNLKFKKPYALIIQDDEGVPYLKDGDLEIVVYGNNLDEIKVQVINDLIFNWQEYVEPNINELDEGAKRLRYSMIALLDKNNEF